MIQQASPIPKSQHHISYPNARIGVIRAIDMYQCPWTFSDSPYLELNPISDLLLTSWVQKLENACYVSRLYIVYDYSTDTAAKDIDLTRETFSGCQNVEGYIVRLVIIIFINEPNTDIDTALHANAIFIDNTTKVAELFEPNGCDAPWYNAVESVVKDELESDGYHLIPLREIMPIIGPQVLSEEGICAAFSKFYIWARLSQPDIPPRLLIFELMLGFGPGPKINLGGDWFNGSKDAINELMTKFVCYEYEYATRERLFELAQLRNDTLFKTHNLDKFNELHKDDPELSSCILMLSQLYDHLVQLDDMINDDVNDLDHESANMRYMEFDHYYNVYLKSIQDCMTK